MKLIFEMYVRKHECLTYILGHKTSQDHLERWFGGIRSSLGCNNNPTIMQFNSAYRKILLGAVLEDSKYGNCTLQDDTELLLPNKLDSSTAFFTESYKLDEDQMDPVDLILPALETNTPYKNQVLNYIAGFKKLSQNEACVDCALFLLNQRIRRTGALINQKNKGSLTSPSLEIEKIVNILDAEFSLLVTTNQIYKIKNLIGHIAAYTCNILLSKYSDIFSELDDHGGMMGGSQNPSCKENSRVLREFAS